MAEASAVLCSGYMTKSPPESKMHRHKWQRRWFVLRKIDEDIKLEYYKDKGETKLKGKISLNECPQVDQGLSFESKKKFHDAPMFGIVTPKRKYFLVTDSEREMIKWVDHICEACGLKLEEEDEQEDYSARDQRFSIQSAPVDPSQRESYIPLGECITNKSTDFSKSLPNNLDVDDPFRARSGNFSSSDSSGESSSALELSTSSLQFQEMLSVKQNDSRVPSNYDIPPMVYKPPPDEEDGPVLPRKAGSVYTNTKISGKKSDPTSATFERQISSQGVVETEEKRVIQDDEIYDIAPKPIPLYKEEKLLLPLDEIYDIAPRAIPIKPPRNTIDFTDHAEQDLRPIYDVPPVKSNLLDDIPNVQDEIYDVPPPKSRPPALPVGYSSPPIHGRSELSNSTDELARSFEEVSLRNSRQFDTYDVPLNLLAENRNPFSLDQAPTLVTSTPPRPPKPAHLSTSSEKPESNFDTYSPADFDHKPFSNGFGSISSSLPASQGHVWLNKTIPTPTPKTRYINARDPKPEGTNNSSQIGYIAMQSVNSPSNKFPAFSDESYMPMEGAPPEGGVDLYTAMGSLPHIENGVPYLPPRPSTSSSNYSDRPPPVDRSNKPRIDSVSGAHFVDTFGLTDSYYATGEEVEDSPFVPSRCSRTKSFTKKGGRYQGTGSPQGTPPQRSNTFTYSSSSSFGYMTSVSSDIRSPGFHSNMGDTPEDTYVFQPDSNDFEEDDKTKKKKVPTATLR